MNKYYEQGEIVYVDLGPTKGVGTNKKRPCVIVSNHHYNSMLNIIIVAPISQSHKYRTDRRYLHSPLHITIPSNSIIEGTILLQHIRSIDPSARINSKPVLKLDTTIVHELQQVIMQFF